MKKFLMGLMILSSFSAFAGEIHWGTATSRSMACYKADQAAEAAALRRDTCYTPCSYDSCEDMGDYYRCYAQSAYYRSSCAKKIDPNNPLAAEF